MNRNKQISLGLAAAMVLSIFLPFIKAHNSTIGARSFSLFDGITDDSASFFRDSYIYVLLIVLFSTSVCLDKGRASRISAGLILICCVLHFWNANDISFQGTELGIIDLFGVGAYLLVASSFVSVIHLNMINKQIKD